jgi:hypothetical protein
MESRTKSVPSLLLFKGKLGSSLLAHPFAQLLLVGVAGALCLFAACFAYLEIDTFKQLEERYSLLKTKQEALQGLKDQEKLLLEKLQTADRFFLDKRLDVRFIDENLRRSDLIQEVESRQEKPVEMNEEELKKVLELIETMPQNSPQIIVKHLHLTKKRLSPHRALFVADMNLIKRERIQP